MKRRIKHIFLFILFGFSNIVNAQDYYIDSLIIEVSKAKADTNKLNILSIIAETAEEDIWPMYNNEMGKLAAKLQRSPVPEIQLCAKKYLAASLNNKGFYFTERGISYKAILYFTKSLEIQREIEDKLGESYSLNNLGSIYDSKGDVSRALEFYFESVKIREQVQHKRGMAESYNNIATVYNHQNDLTNALKYHFKSLKLRKEIGEQRGIGLANNNIGNVYVHVAEIRFKAKESVPDSLIDKSFYYFQEGLKAYQSANNQKGIALSYLNIAGYYILKADVLYHNNFIIYDSLVKQAEIYYDKALVIYTGLEDKEWITNTLNRLSGIYLMQKNFPKAENYSARAMKLANEMGYPEIIQYSAEISRKIHERNGDFKNALAMSDLFYSMRDSILNDNTRKESVTKHFMYENEKKDVLAKANQEKIELTYKAKSKQQRMIIYFVIICLVLLSVFGVFIYKRFKLSQKQNRIIHEQKRVVEHQKLIVEESRKEIVDSINYAKRIQYALLAHKDLLQENLNSHFVFFKPKDIVSGDFYWATTVDRKQETGSSEEQLPPTAHSQLFYLAVCDSTGHGVPGAFMSLLNIGFLSEAIKEKNILEPHEIFNYVRRRLIDSISKEDQQDGMDGVIVCFDKANNKLMYSSAHVSPILVRNNTIKELPKDKMPVGKGENANSFTLQTIALQKDDVLYFYTDGYADQFGGDKGKKFKYKPLNELLHRISSLPMEEQSSILETTFAEWRGVLDQVDDVCVIGVRI